MTDDELDRHLLACAAQYPGSDEWNAMRERLKLAIDAAVRAEREAILEEFDAIAEEYDRLANEVTLSDAWHNRAHVARNFAAAIRNRSNTP